MLNRRSSREAVLGLIFENEFGLYDDKTELYENAVAARGIEENEYIRTLYFGILEKQNELDAYIEKYAKGRTLARISKIAKAVMRISIYEMLYIDDIPASVSINEAVELAHAFSGGKAASFINGILGTIAREAESAPRAEAAPLAEAAPIAEEAPDAQGERAPAALPAEERG